MEIMFREATQDDSEIISVMIMSLTSEISEVTRTAHFNIELNETNKRCAELIKNRQYLAMIGEISKKPIAVATMVETFSLYAGGTIGVIQEFYVSPKYRNKGVGSQLLKEVQKFGLKHNWACIELCTPPLPEFKRTISFYQKNGLFTVGGRKMKQNLY